MNRTDEIDSLTTDDSGVFSCSRLRRAQELAALWQTLEPNAAHEPQAVRALHEAVAVLLRECVTRISGLECAALTGHNSREIDDLLDASYVLERLEWSVLHLVPYVERPIGVPTARLRRGA